MVRLQRLDLQRGEGRGRATTYLNESPSGVARLGGFRRRWPSKLTDHHRPSPIVGHDVAVLDRSLVAVTDIFATTPHVMFCIKRIDGTYVAANQAFADRAGVPSPGDVVGRTAHELFPVELADQYQRQDETILTTGHMLTNELELITRPDGSFGWYLTSKSRWTDDDGAPIGLVTASVDLRTPADAAAPHRRLAAAVEVARTRYAEQLPVQQLADAAEMSIAQLERVAKRVLGITPKQLILRFRLEESLRLITTTDMSIAEIATRCGYYDQSAFNRHFKRSVGVAPSTYRSAS